MLKELFGAFTRRAKAVEITIFIERRRRINGTMIIGPVHVTENGGGGSTEAKTRLF